MCVCLEDALSFPHRRPNEETFGGRRGRKLLQYINKKTTIGSNLAKYEPEQLAVPILYRPVVGIFQQPSPTALRLLTASTTDTHSCKSAAVLIMLYALAQTQCKYDACE